MLAENGVKYGRSTTPSKAAKRRESGMLKSHAKQQNRFPSLTSQFLAMLQGMTPIRGARLSTQLSTQS